MTHVLIPGSRRIHDLVALKGGLNMPLLMTLCIELVLLVQVLLAEFLLQSLEAQHVVFIGRPRAWHKLDFFIFGVLAFFTQMMRLTSLRSF